MSCKISHMLLAFAVFSASSPSMSEVASQGGSTVPGPTVPEKQNVAGGKVENDPMKVTDTSSTIYDLVAPKFSAMKVRLITSETSAEDKAQAKIVRETLEAKDKAMVFAITIQGDGAAKAQIEAYQQIFKVCNLGLDKIDEEIGKNAKRSFWSNTVLAILGVGTAAVGGIATVRVSGVAAAAGGSYKDEIIKNGDTGHNTDQLRSIAEDVRNEMKQAATNFQYWRYKQDGDQAVRQAKINNALLSLNNACSFY